MVERYNHYSENLVKYIIYFLPIFIIIGNASINFILAIITLIYFVKCILAKEILYNNFKEYKYFIFFYLYLFLNSFFSENIILSLNRTIPFLKFFIFVLFTKHLLETKKIKIKVLSYIWLTILIILGLDILYQSFFGYNIIGYKSPMLNRNSSFFFDELVAGGFLIGFIFLIIGFQLKKLESNNFVHFIIIFFLFVIFFTGERASFIKYILVIFVCYLFVLGKLSNFRKLIVSLLIVISSIIFINTSSFKDRYLGSISYSPERDLGILNNYFRSQYGSHALSSFYILRDNLFFGVGNKNFRIACLNHKNKVIDYQKKIDPNARVYLDGCSTHPHQIYFEFLSEHGIIGTFFILFILWKIILNKLFSKNCSKINLLALFYIIITFIPILPSGSFFTTFNAFLFWLNYTFYITTFKKEI